MPVASVWIRSENAKLKFPYFEILPMIGEVKLLIKHLYFLFLMQKSFLCSLSQGWTFVLAHETHESAVSQAYKECRDPALLFIIYFLLFIIYIESISFPDSRSSLLRILHERFFL